MQNQVKNRVALSTAIAIAALGHVEISKGDLETEKSSSGGELVIESDTTAPDQVSALQNRNADLARKNTILNHELASLRQQHELERGRWAAALSKVKKERVFLFSDPEENRSSEQPFPLTTATGDWFINFETYQSKEKAVDRLNTIKDALLPININIFKGVVDGQTVYRVRSIGYETRDATNEAVNLINQRLSEPSLWIGKQDESIADPKSSTTAEAATRELRYVVFVADYTDEGRAKAVAQAFTDNGLSAEAKSFTTIDGLIYKVFVPDLVEKSEAEAVLNSLQKTGSFNGAKILRSFNEID